ncbi:Small nuclear ribonucleoprotein E [Larimichthys crocea]|uniref:Uncharacterized protein n=1 Tax=Larimichthys crocea TaxID=215358 RepID=A0ACD3RIE1_LARCR|nr:Small nuclear ribonucleoprotein E [Larimichthys crocea]
MASCLTGALLRVITSGPARGRKPAIEAERAHNRSRIQVWLYEQVNMRIEGCIIGFDEYMNLVLDDAEEVHMKTKNRKPLGWFMVTIPHTARCRIFRHDVILSRYLVVVVIDLASM